MAQLYYHIVLIYTMYKYTTIPNSKYIYHYIISMVEKGRPAGVLDFECHVDLLESIPYNIL